MTHCAMSWSRSRRKTSEGRIVGLRPDPLVFERLERAWEPAREAGALGLRSAVDLSRHTAGFVMDEWKSPPSDRHFIDVGTGAGVPGILLAVQLPRSRWTLVDSSLRRCEFAERAAQALGISDRVVVTHARVEHLARSPVTRERYDGATARLFGPPAELAECALPLLRPGACMVLSVSSATEERWRSADLMTITGCEVARSWRTPQGAFLAVERRAAAPDRLPRRIPARRRSPLF